MAPFADFLLVGCGGFCGAISRFLVQQIPLFENDKYYYTMGVNLTGCLLIGFFAALIPYFNLPRWVWCLLVTGFLGGYTTYSSFSLDAIQLLEAGRSAQFLTYLAVTLFGGLGLCGLAYWLTQKCLP